MSQHDTAVVYNYLAYDPHAEGLSIARFKATREAISSHFGGEVLEGTAHEVPRAELDELGRYRRIATGWGDLG